MALSPQMLVVRQAHYDKYSLQLFLVNALLMSKGIPECTRVRRNER